MGICASWKDFERFLDCRGMFHMCLGLDRMLLALEALQLESTQFPVIQVLGTNGKGSTSAFLSSLSISHGFKTGLYISPHFVSPRERILINGDKLDEEILLDAADEIFTALGNDPDLTYFELLTILALCVFRRQKIDLAILEAGLGGKNDATSAIRATLQCFTPIAMDHASIIGPGLREIASDKAAAMREGGICFSAPQYASAMAILQLEAKKKAARLEISAPRHPGNMARLRGLGQAINAGLALAAWEYLSGKIDGANARGLSEAFIPGRFQNIGFDSDRLILDGAHNPHGMQWLVKNLDFENLSPAAVVYSCLDDKDWRNALAILGRSAPAARFFIAQLGNGRAASAGKVADFFNGIFGNNRASASGSMSESLRKAIAAASGQPVLLTGSLYLLSEFFTIYPQYLTAQSMAEQPNEV